MNKLKYRHEMKHYINLSDYIVLRSRLRAIMNKDYHADETGKYKIRSLYFDDLHDSALLEKLYGINHREKFRIRYYNDDPSFIRLEKKIKDNGLTSKLSVPLSKEEAIAITNGNINWLKESKLPLLQELYTKMQSGGLKPKTIVDYFREAYTYPAGNVRITFDSSIKTGLFSTDLFDYTLPTVNALNNQSIILEVKFDEFLPEVISDIIQTNERRATSVSKYALSRLYG